MGDLNMELFIQMKELTVEKLVTYPKFLFAVCVHATVNHSNSKMFYRKITCYDNLKFNLNK